jgi:hypothetical protein
MLKVAWKEINRKEGIVVKTKVFKTERTMENFIRKLFGNANFLEIVAYQ